MKSTSMEVIHSLFYSPLYVAHGQGLVRRGGTHLRSCRLARQRQGDSRAVERLGGHSADRTAKPPSTLAQRTVLPKSCASLPVLTATDGSYLVGREADEDFDWADLEGASILSWRRGSSPDIYLSQGHSATLASTLTPMWRSSPTSRSRRGSERSSQALPTTAPFF